MKPTESPEDIREIAPGTILDGRYRVVRTIGQGGNGMVYEVEHARTGRKLALKALLDETGFARLEQEARAASMMKNGHTARIIDMEPAGRLEGPSTMGSGLSTGSAGAYMVMELLEGQSLRGLLDEAGQLPLELTVNIAMQICECLHEAHGLGIIHRDLKPENVFLCASPWPGQYDVKVLDFGVMKISEDGGAIPKSSLTRTGSTVGTPYYMSLEQLRNSSAVDARADIYSLGVVLYECLSGRKPFQADTIGDLVYALCSGPPPQLGRIRPDVPAEIGELIMRTLSAKRDDRPATMIDFAIALVPRANPAFGLWVKVGGKQPALAGAPARPGLGDPSASKIGLLPEPPVARLKTAVLGPLSQPGLLKPEQQEPSDREDVVTAPPPPNEALISPAVSPGELANDVRPADHAPAEVPRRDTPTEMFLQDIHGEQRESREGRELRSSRDTRALEDEDGPGGGDRDTPTRALDLASLTRQKRKPDPDEGEGFDAPTFDGSASRDALPAAMGSPPTPPSIPGFDAPPPGPVSIGVPPPSPAFGTLPLEGYPAAPTEALSRDEIEHALANAPAQQATLAKLATDPQKPNWQLTLDRSLDTVGGFIDVQVKRYQAAPRNSQILIAVACSLLALSFLGLLLLAKLR